jgi:hypothetical protein
VSEYRILLIFTGLVVIGGAGWIAAWIAVAGTGRLVPWWWIAAGTVVVGVAADRSERAITRRLDRPGRDRRRAHAR